ncbi:MAG: TatD family hydrolase [Azospirillaceae bacterium]|nr:TatD family hydrolase [Azospirillaceae bacterium]
MLVDSHCHLDFAESDAARAEIVDRARRAGVGRMLTIGTRVSRFDEVQHVVDSFDDVWCSVGVHPHHAAEEAAVATLDRLRALSAAPKVIAIGETGLDYFYDSCPRDVQQDSFRRHLQLCRETGLPVVVHTRDADEDTARILGEEGAGQGVTGLIHGFSSGRRLAEQALAMGFYLSLSGIVTFKNSEDLRAIVRDVPLDRILVETDAPYLAPVPKRGKTNEPAFIVHTAAAVAAVKGIDAADLAAQTTANFFRLFTRAPAPPGPGNAGAA